MFGAGGALRTEAPSGRRPGRASFAGAISRTASWAALACCLAGCGASFVAADRTVVIGPVRFHVGALSQGWKRASLRGDRIAFHHESGGTISAGATCHRVEDVPLPVLTNHLLFGFSPRKISTQTPLIIDGRAALRSEVEAALDGVPVALELIVLKKDGCLFDLQLAGAPATLGARAADFAGFWRGFSLVSSR